MIKTVMLVAITLCGASLPMAASSGRGSDSAVIVNSGSTNIPGFRIVVERSGNAEYVRKPTRFGPGSQEQPEPVRKKLPNRLVERFFSDIQAAQPFSLLPPGHCMKSASFGSTLTVEFAGEKTSDLSCGSRGNSALESLIRDVKEIALLFGAK